MARVTIDRVLVATDGSWESIEAARFGAALLESLRPKIMMVHVIPNPTIPVGGTTSTPSDAKVVVEKTMWEGAQAILDRSRQPFEEVGLAVEGLIAAADSAPEEIITIAKKERIHLIIIASRGEGGAERAVLGSTSDAVVRGAPCPVLVVRRGTV